MDHNEFFRAGTLAICGNLEIHHALRACIDAVGDAIPAERMFLQLYEPDLGAMRTIAMASAEEGRQEDLLTPLDRATRDRIEAGTGAIPVGFVAFDNGEQTPVAREMLRYHGLQGWSVMWLTLSTVSQRLGSVVVGASGHDRYTDAHAALLASLTEPFNIALYNTLEHREVLRLRDRLADDNRYLHTELRKISGDEIVGAAFGLKPVMQMVQRVAPTESPVLLSGETGVGKDVVANAIHLASSRRGGPFIPVNCGAIPESLLDSELFGHEKGAFTGALGRKRGRFERAHGGTIFLDEIGEMPLEAQVRLLRGLQNREIERIGGTDRIPVDIRILAATNKDLAAQVAAGRFREDLWFRLNVFPIEIPPLRARTADIPALVQHFVRRKARELKLGNTPVLAPGAIDDLVAYRWPGNVRELENLIERAIIIYRDEPLQFDLGGGPRPSPVAASERGVAGLTTLDEAAALHIRRALEACDYKIHGPGGAGEILDINPNTLRNRMRKLGIPFKRSLT